ncbi:MAG: class II fructose-bisphosphate aldolase, partial [Thermoplasmata archaeon]
LDSFSQKAPGKTDEEIFGTYSKFSIREFFKDIYSIGKDTERSVEDRTYFEARAFLDAFESKGTATSVRKLFG